MEGLKGEQDVGGVELGSILLKSTDLTQVKEKFTTRAILKTEVKLALSLEGIVHLDDKAVIDTLLLSHTNAFMSKSVFVVLTNTISITLTSIRRSSSVCSS